METYIKDFMENIISETLETKRKLRNLLDSNKLIEQMWALICDYMDWSLDMNATKMVINNIKLDVYLIDEDARYLFSFKMDSRTGEYCANLDFRQKNR